MNASAGPSPPDAPALDVLLVGGGVAGLWALDVLTSRGLSCLLVERGELGAGQTVASQGIVHGGLKYTLTGLLTGSAKNIREMPGLWRRCVAGNPDPVFPHEGPAGGSHPDLSETPVRAPHCLLWRSESLTGRLGMIGAKAGLRVAPTALAADEIPPVLRGVKGPVCRLDEQVLSPAGLVANLRRRNLDRLLQIADDGVAVHTAGGQITGVTLTAPDGRTLAVAPRHVALTAGAGNAGLLESLDLPGAERLAGALPTMQRRPLHMVLVRGERLPPLSGHCVDGAKTRVTITSDRDSSGRVVWQVGGQLAEDGVNLDPEPLIARAERELTEAIPGLDLSGCDWATYRVDRAEGHAGGQRPEDAQLYTAGNLHVGWPTKLALAPVLAARLAIAAGAASGSSFVPPADWPRPPVAAPPWERCEWRSRQEPLRRAA
ncbi:FAD-dependent oxidoreductase [Alienimonas californiensis]|uniref:Glycerol-3-phosphate dehydrogenase n=1 Tax=Alienimonas californiensis TaxID=2527989 RepID=A0A517P5Y3_9PLAN|nr:FAD-dependent oxidoreductase [Alienimonas californiensis]QDT14765.1 glycerol-3-phosphate dehydrogenase [Alienimonas californiensis]